jgi:sugar phosphate isomerase/epimerase
MKVGIQLFSVKQAMTKDPMGTLKAVAEMGYKYWETAFSGANGLGMPAKEAKKILSDYGAEVVGAHYYPAGDLATQKEFLEYHAQIGNSDIGLAADFFSGYDDILKKCELMNKDAEAAGEYGMRFHYHNHFHEFQKFNDKYVMDIIFENTNPELVFIEIDTYWAERGGVDPVEFMKKYEERLIMLHQKDFPKGYAKPINLFEERIGPDEPIGVEVFQTIASPDCFAEVGTGILDIQRYIDEGNKLGAEYILLEQDYTSMDELESIKLSMDSFRKYSGISWD